MKGVPELLLLPVAVQPDAGEGRFWRLRAVPTEAPLHEAPSLGRAMPRLAPSSRDRFPLPVPLPAAWPMEEADAATRLYGPRWCLLRGLNPPAADSDDIAA
jgi:hypothetical protein